MSRRRSAGWPVVLSLVAVAGFAIVPAMSVSSVPGAGAAAPASVVSGLLLAPSSGALPSIGNVLISATGVSNYPSVVGVNLTTLTASVLESFAGNITDAWPGSTLSGGGWTISSVSYQSNANVVGLTANGITVEDVVTVSTGSTDGIVAVPAVTSATIESSTVTLTTGTSGTAVGIQAGNVFPATAVEPTGTFLLTGNTVTGPGNGGTAGGKGILVYGASVSILSNVVSGFSQETTSSLDSNTYSSWFEDTQSVGIYLGCAQGSLTCVVQADTSEGNSIGVAYALETSAAAPIAPGAATIEEDTITGSGAYAVVAQATDAVGTTVIEHDSLNDSATGAPGVLLIGASFSVTNNVFLGTITTGSNGALQGEGACADPSIPTASVEASDCFSTVTTVALNANIFEDTNAAYWTATFPTNPTSSLSGGELVTFSESGLPSATPWSVAIAGTVGTEAAPSSIIGDLQNGSQTYAISVVPGYYQQTLPPTGTINVNEAPVNEPTLVYVALATGQVVLTSTCVSTDPSLVSMSGTVATLLGSFSGNLTDLCVSSTIDGHGFTINASGLASDANAVGVAANGVTVDDVGAVVTGYTVGGFPQTGIEVAPAVTTVTIEGSTVEASAAQDAPVWGIWAGNFASNPATQTTGAFVLTGNTVIGPGGSTGSTLAGSIGIVAGGASLTIEKNVVRGFSAVDGTPGYSGYNWWDGTQSYAILAACAPGSVTCLLQANTLTDNAIGIVDLLLSSARSNYQTGAVSITGNDINDSGGYGVYADMSAPSADGGAGATGTSAVTGNIFDNTLTGAPALLLTGATVSVDGNEFIGTTTTGTQGASQDQQGNMPAIPTTAVEATDYGNAWRGPDGGVTHLTLVSNYFVNTTALWSATFEEGSGSTLLGGELVSFAETGLGPGTLWYPTLTQGTVSGTGRLSAPTGAEADVANGTATYSVAAIPGYTVASSSGMLTVNAGPLAVSFAFTRVDYVLTFQETGLPSATLWSVTVGAVKQSSSTASIVFTEPNGTYDYSAGTLAGYVATGGTLVVNGADLTVAVAFVPATYTVSFTETGLPKSTEWWVNLSASVSFHAKSPTISFVEPNGSYAYHFGVVNTTSRQWEASAGAVTVAGASLSTAVPFTTFFPVKVSQGILPYGTEWWVNVTSGPPSSASSTSTVLEFWASNGVYRYAVGTTDKQYASRGGSFVLHNAGVSRKANFVLQKFSVTVEQTGLPSGTRWCVDVTGEAQHCTSQVSERFPEPNGTFAYTLTTPRPGYTAPGGSFQVSGATTLVSVTFTSNGGGRPTAGPAAARLALPLGAHALAPLGSVAVGLAGAGVVIGTVRLLRR